MNKTPGSVAGDQKSIAVRSLALIGEGTPADFDELIHPAAVNREDAVQPMAARVPGPAGFLATAEWLRSAYAELRYEALHVVADGDLVAVNTRMSGRHVGPFVLHQANGEVDTVFPPTGKTFAVEHTHWLRIADGKVIEHWAQRDDMGQATQLGWIPPSPLYLAKMAQAKRKAKRAVRAGD